jgi:hypothetical protein
VTLSVAGLPGGASGSFSPNPVTPALPAASSTLSIGNTAGVAAGSYTLTITGDASGPSFPAASHDATVDLLVAAAAPDTVSLQAPSNGAINVGTQPTLSWQAVAGAESYRVEVATDAGFGNVVFDTVVAGTSLAVSTPLATSTVHYWRVTANNACGSGASSAVYSFRTIAAPGDCGVDQEPVSLLSEDFSGGLGGFTTSIGAGSSNWTITGSAPAGSPSGGNAVFAADVASVSDQRLVSPAVTLPADQLPLSLQFWNRQQLESATGGGCWDGGVLEISGDDGSTWTQVTGSAILHRPYDAVLPATYNNPLANMGAWCGNPRDWERYMIDLNAWAGQTVRFRWRLGTDSSVGAQGWYVDDIRVQACQTKDVIDDRIFADGFEGDGPP